MPAEVETMMFVGETPWHGLGTELQDVATAEEAIKAAGLDWEVELVPLYLFANDITEIVGKKALIRQADQKVYNIVSDRYVPVQNRTAFSFFDSVTGTEAAKYHTAGSLKEGRVVWMLAKLTESMGIKGEQIDKYLLLSNSHDGTLALQMFFTPVRVVCMNTLSMALTSGADKFYARHTTNIATRIETAREILGMTNTWYAQWKEQAERLATLQLPPAEMPLLLTAAFGYEGIPMEQVWAPVREDMEKIPVLMETGRGMDNTQIRGTKWAAYNAIAEHCDHYKRVRGNNQEKRLYSAWFGQGNEIKRRAWSYLLR